jgi:Phage tail assembly chaperone protein
MNKIYWDAATNGFFHSNIHGPRRIEVIDEAAQNEALAALTAREDEEDADADAIWAARVELRMAPPMMEVDNPDCRIPAEAVEISQEAYKAVMECHTTTGKRIVSGKDGIPVLAEPQISAQDLMTAARARRDRALADSDWTQLPDSMPPAQRKAWAAYRQHLRSLPKDIQAALANGLSELQAMQQLGELIARGRPQ